MNNTYDRHSSPSNTSDTTHAPNIICQECQEGPFIAQLGLFELIVRDPWPGTPKYGGGYTYSSSRAYLESSARQCLWCRLVFDMCSGQDFASDGPLTITLGKSAEWESILSSHCSLNDIQGLVMIINGREVFKGYVHATADDPAAAYIVARSPLLEVGSPRALELARQYLNECEHGHVERCLVLSNHWSFSIPSSRLIDCSCPDSPCLVATTDLPTHTRYLALSYVWGGEQPYSTRMANVSSYEKGIDASKLPQTIQDAIHVTHSLGFLFLWADSLCIIQDSGEDKIHEIGRMDQIYRGASLTIIAASAPGASEGFLRDRPASPHDIVLPFFCPQRPTTSVRDSINDTTIVQQGVGRIRLSPLYTQASGEIPRYSHAQEPVNTRAWCMQEHLMSQRALIFTSETLQFRCHTSTQNIGHSFYDSSGERRLPDTLFYQDTLHIPCDSEEWRALHQAWLDIVEDYSRRSVGFPSDKLVACGAIAREFRRVLDTDYLAGLWRHTLLSDLLWLGPRDSHSPPPSYRAPSWSWASVDGQVKMEPQLKRSERTALSEVVRCGVTLKNDALPFGEVTDGALVLRTPALMRCTLNDGSEPGEICVQLHPQPDQLRRPGAAEEPEVGDGVMNINYFGAARIDRGVDATLRSAWAVPLHQKGHIIEGLLVAFSGADSIVSRCWRKLRGRDSVTYRRVGVFHVPAEGLDEVIQRAGELRMVEITIV
ncbi:heterokaryon incompatibility protein-domain-containing protein [Trametes gibbosa]|nr:heterokaryon incompatibility protein-domain-containing protein [Trametes gibbosa]